MVSAIIGGGVVVALGAYSPCVAEFCSLQNRRLVMASPSLSMMIDPRGEIYVAVFVMASYSWLSEVLSVSWAKRSRPLGVMRTLFLSFQILLQRY